MRNIRIADPKDRLHESPPIPSASARRSRLRDALATIPILLLAPALVVPVLATSAATATLRVEPDDPTPGAEVTVTGTGFERGLEGTLVTDDDEALTPFEVSSRGRFSVTFTLPESFDVGSHEIEAVDASGDERASLDLEVVPADAAGEDASTEPGQDAAPAEPAAPEPTPTAKPVAPKVKPAPPKVSYPAPVAKPVAPTTKPSGTSSGAAGKASTSTPVAPGGILMSASQIARLPMSGAAWSALKARADASIGSPNLSNQDDNTDQAVLAKALVYARTGVASYRASVVAALKKVVGTEAGGRTLALGRNLPAYVIAADLISLKSADAAFDSGTFRPWLRSLLTKTLDGRTLISTHEQRPNNWGTHAGAARAAIAAYLGDAAQLARTAQVFRGYLGDRSAYAGFKYGDLAWQCDPKAPVGINKTGCTKGGVDIGGALPEEMRRAGSFSWPPRATGYAWEGLQGAVLQAELLRVAGYDAWSWSDRALLRATAFLYRIGWKAEGDDTWQPWLIDARYGTAFRGKPPARAGKNYGYTDWSTGL